MHRAVLTFPLRARLRSFSRIEGLVGSASEDQRKGYARESSERPHDAKNTASNVRRQRKFGLRPASSSGDSNSQVPPGFVSTVR
jgi:hypothetical protein